MDTKRLEQIAETLVTSKLLVAGILPAKPFFDCAGADLVGFTSVDDRGRFCRIQCKYRALKKRTLVSIDASYVVGAFVLFIYLRMGKDTRLYCLTPEEIRRVFKCCPMRSKTVYRLGITHKTISTLAEFDYILSPIERNAVIFHVIKASSPNAEFANALSGLRSNMNDLSELQQKRDDLRELIHQMELTDLEIIASEEKLKILEEYTGFLEKHVQGQERLP